MNQPHKHEKIILKLLSEDDRIEYCLSEGRLIPSILEEAKAITERDVKEVAASIKKTEAEIATVLKASQDAKVEVASEYFKQMNDLVKQINKMIATVSIAGIAENPVIAQQILSTAIATEDSASKFTQAITKGLALFSENLTPIISDENKKTPINKLEESDEIPAQDKLKSGLIKALSGAGLKPDAEDKGGFFSKLMKGAKNLYKRFMGTDAEKEEIAKTRKVADAIKSIQGKKPQTPSAEALAEDIMNLSLEQINAFSDKLKSAKMTPPPKGSLKTLTAKIQATPTPGPEDVDNTSEKSPSPSNKGKVSIKQIRSDLEKAASEAGVADTGKVINALLSNDAVKSIFSESRRSVASSIPMHKQRISTLLFEAEVEPGKNESQKVKFSQIKDAIASTAGDKSSVAAAKIIAVLKGKGADVDDSDIPADVKTAVEEIEKKKTSERDQESKPDNSEEQAKDVEANVKDAARNADKQPLGKTVLDAVKGFATPYKDKKGVMSSIDRLAGDIRDKLDDVSDNLSSDLNDVWSNWFDNLPVDVIDDLGVTDPQKGIDIDSLKKPIEDAINSAVKDNLKMENFRKRIDGSNNNFVLNESRWARLAGIKDEN